MRLRSFEVKGFKNLRRAVRLDDLGAVNVVHGDNNVGKSNLMESIELFFSLLARCVCDKPAHGLHKGERSARAHELRARHPFDLRAPRPIEMRGIVELDPEEIARSGLQVGRPLDAIELGVRAVPSDDGGMVFGIDRFTYPDGFDAASLDDDHADSIAAARLLRVIARADRRLAEATPHTFSHVNADREVNGGNEARDGIVAQTLINRLYNARESLTDYKLWELFRSVMAEFDGVLGPGEFVLTASLGAQHAQLVRQTPEARIPVGLLGSGVQQAIELVARLILSRAEIIAIEEPELNLRHSLQERLKDIFARLTSSRVGPQQLFITSHSYAFETGTFYAMDATPEGPVVTRRSSALARGYTGHPTEDTPVGASAPVSYVSNEGIVRLPAPVRERLGLQHGGGVVFLTRDDTGHVEMLTNEQFFAVVGE